jgi:hypothetical protein
MNVIAVRSAIAVGVVMIGLAATPHQPGRSKSPIHGIS